MKAADFLAAAAALPLRDLGAMPAGGIVVVAPHPDDESLGCGGLIAADCARGGDVRLVVLSDGVGSHPHSRAYPPSRLRALRERETLAAARTLGLAARNVTFLRLPDRHVCAVGAVASRAAERIAGAARDCRAGALVVTCEHDPHCDHQAAFMLARRALTQLPGTRLYAYPIWAWTLPADQDLRTPEPRGFRLDISGYLRVKREAIRQHRSQTTDLIDDDPTGFRLDQAMLARFDCPFETFLEIP